MRWFYEMNPKKKDLFSEICAFTEKTYRDEEVLHWRCISKINNGLTNVLDDSRLPLSE